MEGGLAASSTQEQLAELRAWNFVAVAVWHAVACIVLVRWHARAKLGNVLPLVLTAVGSAGARPEHARGRRHHPRGACVCCNLAVRRLTLLAALRRLGCHWFSWRQTRFCCTRNELSSSRQYAALRREPARPPTASRLRLPTRTVSLRRRVVSVSVRSRLPLRRRTHPAVATRRAQRRQACVRGGGRWCSELCAVRTASTEQRHGAHGFLPAGGRSTPDTSLCIDGRRCDCRLSRWPYSRGLDALLRRSLRSVPAVAAAALVQSEELPDTRCAAWHLACALAMTS